MPWAKFDDRYPWHRKVRPLSDAAFRLDVSSVCWCSENLTDGVIQEAELSLLSDVKRPVKAAAELLALGRWHPGEHGCEGCPQGPRGGFVIHDFLVYNPTREKVERDREQRRKAGERGGVASGRARSKTEASRFDSAKQNGSETEATGGSSVTNPRTRTRSRTSVETSVGNATEVDAQRDPNEPPKCRQHKGMLRAYVPDCLACARKRQQWETSRAAEAEFGREPWCGDDECNPITRKRTTPFGDILCPECHPLAEEASA